MSRRTRTAAVQVREMLVTAKRLGIPFEEAWPAALRNVAWPYDTPARQAERLALECYEDVWRSCYQDHPESPAERCLRVLSDLLEAAEVEHHRDAPSVLRIA